jgi:hypothetical protein
MMRGNFASSTQKPARHGMKSTIRIDTVSDPNIVYTEVTLDFDEKFLLEPEFSMPNCEPQVIEYTEVAFGGAESNVESASEELEIIINASQMSFEANYSEQKKNLNELTKSCCHQRCIFAKYLYLKNIFKYFFFDHQKKLSKFDVFSFVF